jgi:serine/threonine protein kinase
VDLIRKELTWTGDKATLEKEFGDELEILSSLRCLKHTNIINLITAYTKGTTYNFIFPVADGDLQDLLFPKHRIPDFKIDINEMLRSLWGLSSAIDAVHEYSAEEFEVHRIGCHYDIKPGNILRQNGRLILSDFGLSRLRQINNGSRSLFKKGEGCYLAPECEPSENDFKPGQIGRSSDIWSFGCVLAEILAYLSAEDGDGPASVMKFRTERKITLGPLTGYHFYGGEGVNPTVVKFLNKFLVEDSSPGRDFESLAFIVKDMLQLDQEKRPKSRNVTRALFHLAQKNILEEIYTAFISYNSLIDLDLQIELLRFRIWGDTVG